MSAYVLGQAAWMPGRPDVAAIVDGPEVAGADAPDLAGYPSRLMRMTSLCTRMTAAVARQALAGTPADPRHVPSVFGSAFGELTIAIEQLQMMVTGDGQISPALFKNSVHNTGAGVFSIAHENRTMTTTLAAGRHTVAYALLEAQMVLRDGAPFVLVVVGDETPPEPLARVATWPSFAAAWLLGASAPPAADAPRIRLGGPHPGDRVAAEIPAILQGHPCGSAYPILRAIHHRRAGAVGLGHLPDPEFVDDEAWSVTIDIESKKVQP